MEQLAGNAKRLRQLRYPVSMCDDDDDDVATCQQVCAVLVYRGKRDAIKAVRRISAQTLAGSIFRLSVCVCIVILCWFAVVRRYRLVELDMVKVKVKVTYLLPQGQHCQPIRDPFELTSPTQHASCG